MSTLRIDNKSEDDILITLDGKDHELRDGESISLDSVEKGIHNIVFHRKRIPKETMFDIDKPKGLDAMKNADEKPGSHIQLDTSVEFEIISSKAAVTVFKKVTGIETLQEDAILVAYKTEISGAKNISLKDSFANSRIKRTYILQQLKNAFLPVGAVGIVAFLLGFISLMMILSGTVLKLGDTNISKTSAILVTAAGAAILIFFIINVIKILNRAKELSR